MTVRVCRDADELAAVAADQILETAVAAIRERGRFRIALAGGSTPEKTYGLLAQPERARSVDWTRWLFFFGDERFVPHDDPRSNAGMAKRTLLDRVPLSPGQVFPIVTNLPSPADSAADYSGTLAQMFGIPADGSPPHFDLILLGMGDDGHTASLFPGKPALAEDRAWVTWSPPGIFPPPVDRVTLTFPTLNAARAVLFLVAGEKKAAPLRDALAGSLNCPAAGVRPTNGTVTWLVDEAAATLLTPRNES